ncbi:MAG: hypothetical protein ACI828_000553 [Flavobacteriales bacterium]|jgi:hypothetical protein
MEIETLLFVLLIIIVSCLVIMGNKEIFMWNFNTEKKLNTFIFDLQKKKKLCSGRITYPTKNDFQKYNVTGSDSNFLFEKKFYRVIICKDSPEEERVFVLVTNTFVVTKLKILSDR